MARLSKEIFPGGQFYEPENRVTYERPHPDVIGELLKSARRDPHTKIECFTFNQYGEFIAHTQFTPFTITTLDENTDMQTAMTKATFLIVSAPSPTEVGRN